MKVTSVVRGYIRGCFPLLLLLTSLFVQYACRAYLSKELPAADASPDESSPEHTSGIAGQALSTPIGAGTHIGVERPAPRRRLRA